MQQIFIFFSEFILIFGHFFIFLVHGNIKKIKIILCKKINPLNKNESNLGEFK